MCIFDFAFGISRLVGALAMDVRRDLGDGRKQVVTLPVYLVSCAAHLKPRDFMAGFWLVRHLRQYLRA